MTSIYFAFLGLSFLHNMVITTVITTQCCQEWSRINGCHKIYEVLSQVSCVPQVLKVLAIIIISQSCRLEENLHSTICVLVAVELISLELSPCFSLYLVNTHLSFPASHIPSSFIIKTSNSLSKQRFQFHSWLIIPCNTHRERAVGTVTTWFTVMMKHSLQN